MDCCCPPTSACRTALRHCTLLSAAVMLAYGRVLSGATPSAGGWPAVVWSGPVHGGPADRPKSASAPRPRGSVVHHASGGVAAAAVLVEQARQVNLSRLGGLQGP
ncbi:MAG: hypothetical protein ACE5GE_03690 [Phycisphaerae bacterium]